MNKTKTVVEFYQEAQWQLENIQNWRNAMMDKVREEARKKASQIHEGYMIEEMEESMRNVAKDLIILAETCTITEEDIKGYTFTPEGLEVSYENPNGFLDAGSNTMLDSTGEFIDRFITVNFTWEDLQNGIDKQLRSQARLQQSSGDGIEEGQTEET